MDTQNQPNQPPKRLKFSNIKCPVCHEEYSATYPSCPWCKEKERQRRIAAQSAKKKTARAQGHRASDEKENPPSERGADSGTQRKSGRRVAHTSRGGGYNRPAYLSKILFFAFTLGLIVAACTIVGSIIGPLLNYGTDPEVETDPSPSVEESYTPTVLPEVVDEPDVLPSTVTAISLSHYDVTLKGGESFTLESTLTPADADETVIWTSSDTNALSISLDGVVTNTNTGSSTLKVTVTATVGDISNECIVYCRSSSASTTTSSSSTTGTGNATVAAASGLRVRSGPSTDNDVITTLENGSVIMVLSTPTSGWYEISYSDESGVTQTGYASSSYINIG